MTIIEVRGGDGRVRHRCDARCYNGRIGTKCKCICGGRNHGKGLQTAVEQTRSAEFAYELGTKGPQPGTLFVPGWKEEPEKPAIEPQAVNPATKERSESVRPDIPHCAGCAEDCYCCPWS